MRCPVLLLLGLASCCCFLAPPLQAAQLRRSYLQHQKGNQEILDKLHRALQQTAQRQQDIAGDAANETAALCQRWGLKPAAAGAKVPRVFDFFLADHELDIMEIRLHEVAHVVDKIFILESRQTFRSTAKPLAFPSAIPRLNGDIVNKIHYTVLDTLTGKGAWGREQYQRNQLLEAAVSTSGVVLDPDDILIVSDLDEIPKPDFIRAMKQCDGIQYPAALVSYYHHYSFDYTKSGSEWDLGPRAMRASQRHTKTAEQLRNRVTTPNAKFYNNASWHCSYCFGQAAMFLHKLSAFSHSEVDTPLTRNISHILRSLHEGWAFSQFDKRNPTPPVKPEWHRIPPDQVDAPSYIWQHQDRFGYLLTRNSDNAGLSDIKFVDGQPVMIRDQARMRRRKRRSPPLITSD